MTASMDAPDDVLVAMLRRGELCSEYLEGEWRTPGEDEPWAVISYSEEPSPETGHIGWVWWAQGKTGDAPTIGLARYRAVQALRGIERW
jgi:hypothetical protein